MSDQRTKYPISTALLATAVYSLITIVLYATIMWIPAFAFPFAWLFGCIVGAPFFVYLSQVTGKSVAFLPMMAAGIGMTIAQSQAYALLGYLAMSQLMILFTMTVATQAAYTLIRKHNTKKDNPKPISPILFTGLLVVLVAAGFTLGSAFGAYSGQGPANQVSEEQLFQQLQSNDMQRRWDAFDYLATQRPLLLAEATMSENSKIQKGAIKKVQTHRVNAVITELNRIIQEDANPIRVAAATKALQEIGPPLGPAKIFLPKSP